MCTVVVTLEMNRMNQWRDSRGTQETLETSKVLKER